MNSPSAADESLPLSFFRQTARFVRSFWTDAGKQAAGNLAGLIACQGLSLICQFANLFVLANVLGEAAYGSYLTAMAFFPFFYCIGSLAGGAIGLRDIRLQPARFEEIASSSLTLSAAVSVMLAALAFAALPFVPVSADERLLFAIVAGGALFPCLGLSSLFDAHHRQGLSASASVVVECLNTIALFSLAAMETLSIRSAAGLLLGRWMLTTLLQWGLFLRFVRSMSFRATASTMRRILVASTSPILMALIWNANIYLSIVFVRLRFDTSETAIYAIAMNIAMVAVTTNDLVLRILSPHILGEHGLRPDFLRKLAIFLTAFTIAISIGAFLGAVLLVHMFPNPVYRAILTPLAWMLVAVMARSWWAVNDWYLLRFDKQRISLLAMFCTAVGSSLFGWLTPVEFGSSGFPIGMFIFFSAAALFTSIAARRAFVALSLRERIAEPAPSSASG